MDAWEDASFNEVSDYKSEKQETCLSENWVKDPPNILIFNLNRVKYDVNEKRLVKDCSKFVFDKKIHVDQLLEANIGRIGGVKRKTNRLRNEIKVLRKQQESCKKDKTPNNLMGTINFLKKTDPQNSQNQS